MIENLEIEDCGQDAEYVALLYLKQHCEPKAPVPLGKAILAEVQDRCHLLRCMNTHG